MSMTIAPSNGQLPNEINVVIEIPAMSEPVKYEYNKDTHLMHVDRFMGTCMQYPANYGFIPNTLAGDGDPVDVLVVTPVPLIHGAVIATRPVGILQMEDESGADAKVLAVPVDKLSPLYRHVKTREDLPELLLKQIVHFFEHYKALESGKWVKVTGWGDLQQAHDEILAGVERAK